MKRKAFLPQAAVSSGVFLAKDVSNFYNHDFSVVRIPPALRKYTRQAATSDIVFKILNILNKEFELAFERYVPARSRAPGMALLALMKDARI